MFRYFHILAWTGLFLGTGSWASDRVPSMGCQDLLKNDGRIEFSRVYGELRRSVISDLQMRTQRNRDILLQIQQGFFGFSLSHLSRLWDNMQNIAADSSLDVEAGNFNKEGRGQQGRRAHGNPGPTGDVKAENLLRQSIGDNFSNFLDSQNFTNAPRFNLSSFQRSVLGSNLNYFETKLGHLEAWVFLNQVLSRTLKTARPDSPHDQALRAFIESDRELSAALDRILRPMNPSLADYVRNMRELALFDIVPYANPKYVQEGRVGISSSIRTLRRQLDQSQD